MKKFGMMITGLLISGACIAESIVNVDRLICATNTVMLCVEDGVCFPVMAEDLGMPQFLVVDLKKKTLSTTEASGSARSSELALVHRENGRVYLQGIEIGRAFTMVVEEDSGIMTGSVLRDGIAVAVFGACTDAKVK